MNKFIKLNLGDTYLFVNVNLISSFYKEHSDIKTTLYTAGDTQYYTVKETPDEILNLIEKNDN